MNTPWGTIQNKTQFERGISFVVTSSHGGLMISKARAEILFSPSALIVAIKSGNYYFFEEDCAISIAIEDSPLVLHYLANDLKRTQTELLSQAIKANRYWYPLYKKEAALIRCDKNGEPKRVTL